MSLLLVLVLAPRVFLRVLLKHPKVSYFSILAFCLLDYILILEGRNKKKKLTKIAHTEPSHNVSLATSLITNLRSRKRRYFSRFCRVIQVDQVIVACVEQWTCFLSCSLKCSFSCLYLTVIGMYLEGVKNPK